MVAAWAARRAGTLAAVDAAHGEGLLIEPLTRERHGGLGLDPDRPAFTVVGILRVLSGEIDRGVDQGGAWQGRMAADRAEASIRHDLLPAGMVLRKGDRVTAVDRFDAPRFEVSRGDPRQIGRLVLYLTPLS